MALSDFSTFSRKYRRKYSRKYSRNYCDALPRWASLRAYLIVLLALASLLLVVPNFSLSQAQTLPTPELGIMWLTKSTVGYQQLPLAGRRYRLPHNQAYLVVDLMLDELGKPWRKLKLTQHFEVKTGVGWSPLEAHQLASDNQIISLYPEPPADVRSPLTAIRLPASHVFLLNTTSTVRGFPKITWNNARYRTKKPAEAWLPAESGIFRIGISATHILESYQDMVSRQVPLKKRNRLLNGLLVSGDTQQEVRWALGEPQLIRFRRQNYLRKQAIWEYSGFSVVFKSNETVESVNP